VVPTESFRFKKQINCGRITSVLRRTPNFAVDRGDGNAVGGGNREKQDITVHYREQEPVESGGCLLCAIVNAA
jgi:hypothetical protein